MASVPFHSPAEQRDAISIFVERVRESPHNLVSRRALEELESRHVPECLGLAAMLPTGPARLLDVGSGGGFPGLVIAAVRPDLEVTLLEGTRKKAVFLRDTAGDMGLGDVRVVNGRAEELSGDVSLAGMFDLVTARAVAPLRRLVPWTLPFLGPSGRLYAVKGEQWEAELLDAEPVMAQLGAVLLEAPASPERRADDPPDPGGAGTGPPVRAGDGDTAVRPLVVIIGRAS